MRYSFKTLLLLPPLVALVCFMYLMGYQQGNRDEKQLKTAVQLESRAHKAAELLAQTNADVAVSARQAAEIAHRETRLAMTTLKSLVFEIQRKLDAAPSVEEFRHHLLNTAADGLKRAALVLKPANEGDDARIVGPEDHDLVWSHLDLGQAFLLLSDFQETAAKETRTQFQAAQEIARAVVQLHPQNAEAQHDLFISDAKLGDLDRHLGFAVAARDDYREALEMCQNLAQTNRKNAVAQRILSVSYSNLGDMLLRLSNAVEARECYQGALEISLGLTRADPRNAEVQRDLAALYGKLGDAHMQLNDEVVARNDDQRESGTFQDLAQADPQIAGVRGDRYISYEKLGDGNRQLASLTDAREAYQKSLELTRKFARNDPQSVRFQCDLAHSFGRLACLEMAAEDFSTAAKWLEQGIAILERLDRAGEMTGPRPYEKPLKDQRDELLACQAAIRAVDDPDFVLRQPKEKSRRLLGVRSRMLARNGRHSDATAAADKLAGLEPRKGDALLNAAEAYALCVASIKPAGPQVGIAAKEKELQDRYAARAVELLKKAREAGYLRDVNAVTVLLANENLASLGSRDDFKNLLAELDAEAADKKRQTK